MLLTLVGLGGAALLLYTYLRREGFTEPAGICGLILFFSLGGLIFNLRDFYLADPLALCAIAWLFNWLWPYRESRKDSPKWPGEKLPAWWPGLVVLLLGVAAKETVLAVLPLVLGAKGLRWRVRVVLCLAPVALLVGLRLFFPASNNYNLLAEMNDVWSHNFVGEGVSSLAARLNFAFLGTWGPALVLLFYRPSETLAYLLARRDEVLYLAIIYGQLLIAHNVDRLLVYGFVVIIPLLVHKAARLSEESGLNLYGLMTAGLVLQLTYFYARPPLWASLAVCLVLASWLLTLSRPVKLLAKG
jgi:hypothetical protein